MIPGFLACFCERLFGSWILPACCYLWTPSSRRIHYEGVGGSSRDSFMRMLASRYLQMIGLSVGELPVFGSGSWWAVQHLLGHDVETRPPIAEGVAVCLALLPVCAWVVEKYLGVSWVGLLCFMTVQHLCCEYRKWHDNTKQRRPATGAQNSSFLHWSHCLGRRIHAF